jgi:chorismate dehydratase
MSIPVAMIPYANMAPYRRLGPPNGCHFVSLVPRKSIRALMEGRVVAAAVPVGGLARLGDRVEMVGRFGIAAKGASMSVLLFSRFPLAQLHAPRTLRLTGESATSVRLLYLLLGHSVGFSRLPRMAAVDQEPDAELLIGDRALTRNMTSEHPWEHVMDLSQAWLDLHGLPFVFARWVVRKDASAAIKKEIAGWLDRFKAREEQLVEQAIHESARQLQLDSGVIKTYFQVIRRSLDEEDIRGQRLFLKQIEGLERDALFPAG